MIALRSVGMLTCVALSCGAIWADDAKTKDAKNAGKAATKTTQIAHIRLSGSLEEGVPQSDPLFGVSTETFKTTLDRVRKAQNDSKIQGLILHFDGLELGYARVAELRQALADFRKSGKKLYAYLESGTSKDYLVACEADKVCMPASGMLMLMGTRAELMFFKGLLEKLGIRAEFLQFGIFKSAGERFTRDRLSDPAQKQYELVLNDFFATSYRRPILQSRGEKGVQTGDLMNALQQGILTARSAQQRKLIDVIGYEDEFEKQLLKDLAGTELKVVRDYGKDKAKEIDLSNPFALFQMLAPKKTTSTGKKDRIAIIFAVGPIMTGKSSPSIFGDQTLGSTTIIEAIREAEKDPKVKSIVLRVDSPGGSALASDLIWKELKQCKKPVIASMGDTAASGGYYISMGCKKIYADEGTLTGSIGVVGGKLSIGGLLEKAGVTTQTLSVVNSPNPFSMVRGFSPEELKAMEAMMKEIYDDFVDKVVESRNAAGQKFTRQAVLDLAEGRIWSGAQAKQRGLVDEVGSLHDALADARKLGGLADNADVDYLVLPKPRTFLDSLMDKGLDLSVLNQAELRFLSRMPELTRQLRHVDTMLRLRQERVWLTMPHGIDLQ